MTRTVESSSAGPNTEQARKIIGPVADPRARDALLEAGADSVWSELDWRPPRLTHSTGLGQQRRSPYPHCR